MSAANTHTSGVLGGILGFLGLSALAGALVAVMVAPAVAVTGVAANSAVGAFNSLPDTLQLTALSQPSTIYAMDGDKEVMIAQFWDKNRQLVTYDQISEAAIHAAIAAEDKRFYEHSGVDVLGLFRAAFANLSQGGVGEGASTITMQLVRNTLREIAEDTGNEQLIKDAYEVTLERKLQEIKYAIAMEKQYSKEEIVTAYLNISIFGGQTYGIQAAAQRYYSKDAIDLTPGEAASLVAIVQFPTAYRLDLPNSESNGEANGYAANKQRRNDILRIMHAEGFLTAAELEEELALPIEPKLSPIPNGCQYATTAPFFCDYITHELRYNEVLGATQAERQTALKKGGLKIYSTLDISLQKEAEKLTRDHIPTGRHSSLDLGSVITSVEVGTGRILVMAQNKTYDATEENARSKTHTSINYAADKAHGGSIGFQTGSTFKAFVLATWLTNGHAIDEVVDSTRRTFQLNQFTDTCLGAGGGTWNPKNAGAAGPSMSVLTATTRSVNTAYVDMASKLDLCDIRKTAEALGATRADGNPLHPGPSMGLGTDEVAPLQMAVAYAGFANGGLSCPPIAIDRIIDGAGQELPLERSECVQAISEDVANGVAYALRRVITGGTGSPSNPGGSTPVIGKTGSTDRYQQTWIVTATKKVATAVWVGNVTGKADTRRYRAKSGGGLSGVRHVLMRNMLRKINSEYPAGGWSSPSSGVLNAPRIEVPTDLVGLTDKEATEILKGLGFSVAIGKPVTSNQAAGTIGAYSPNSGSVPRGTMITLQPSDGQGIAVPATQGLLFGGAVSELQSVGFTGTFTEVHEHHDTIPAGQVIRTSPAEGSMRKASTNFTIYVSDGPAPIIGP